MGDVGPIPGLEIFPEEGNDKKKIKKKKKEMTTHSSIVAWKIPWTEKLGRLQSLGSQRV